MDVGAYLLGLLPGIITSAIAYYWQRQQKKRDAEVAERANARKRESLLSLDIQIANSKLAYAAAMAIKNGRTNGEMEEAITAYLAAREAWEEFMREQMQERLLHD